MKFGDTFASIWMNGTVFLPPGCGDCYDIVVYPDGSTSSRRKKRSDALSPNFSRQLPMDSFYPTFLSLKLKVYLSTSWKVSLIMYFSSTYPSSIYSWSHFGTWNLLFGQLWVKKKIEYFWATFDCGFFNFLWEKKLICLKVF